MVKDLMPLIRSNPRWISENSIHEPNNQNSNHVECHTSLLEGSPFWVSRQWIQDCLNSHFDNFKLYLSWYFVINTRYLTNYRYKLKSGATKRSQTEGFQINDAEKWIQHENYDVQGDKNDIALIKMKKKFKDTPKVNTICLPLDKTKKSRFDKNDVSGEYDAIIAGWGFTTKMGNQGPIADTLQKLPLKIVKHGICKENMKGYQQVRIFNALHPDKTICAGGELEKDSCGGDSGGPLVTMKKVGGHIVYTVIGITSWGPTMCGAKKDEYGIYTNVAYFNDWILNNIS